MDLWYLWHDSIKTCLRQFLDEVFQVCLLLFTMVAQFSPKSTCWKGLNMPQTVPWASLQSVGAGGWCEVLWGDHPSRGHWDQVIANLICSNLICHSDGPWYNYFKSPQRMLRSGNLHDRIQILIQSYVRGPSLQRTSRSGNLSYAISYGLHRAFGSIHSVCKQYTHIFCFAEQFFSFLYLGLIMVPTVTGKNPRVRPLMDLEVPLHMLTHLRCIASMVKNKLTKHRRCISRVSFWSECLDPINS